MKLIISENIFKKIILENDTVMMNITKNVMSFLDKNFSPSVQKVEENGEFVDRHVFTKKINKDIVNSVDLLEYLDDKFNDISDDDNLRQNFLKQAMKDWYNGYWHKNKMLSSVVPIN